MTGSSVACGRAVRHPDRAAGDRGARALGLLAALAGIHARGQHGSFTATIGEEFMLPSFLGPILGGTLLAGGASSVWGTVLGTALTSVIHKGLDLLRRRARKPQHLPRPDPAGRAVAGPGPTVAPTAAPCTPHQPRVSR